MGEREGEGRWRQGWRESEREGEKEEEGDGYRDRVKEGGKIMHWICPYVWEYYIVCAFQGTTSRSTEWHMHAHCYAYWYLSLCSYTL